jgi:holo-[acyl-carrier protein] synthase
VSSPGNPRLRHGIDLVDLAEFRRVFDRHAAFEDRVFSVGEREYCRARPDPATHFAARFAAKEATLKALGMGMGAVGIDARLKDIEVTREGGPPEIVLHGKMARAADRHGVGTTALSLSHSREAAIASVIMMSFQPDDAGGERV